MILFNFICVLLLVPFSRSAPFDLSGYFNDDAEENSTQIVEVNNINGTKKDLYVIKTIVYEVAVLADSDDDDNSTESGTYTQEKVDLTFYNARGNGTHIDLGDIPIPVQANISGHVVTGIAPVHAGTIPQDPETLAALLPEGASVTLTKAEEVKDDQESEEKMEVDDNTESYENLNETNESSQNDDGSGKSQILQSNEDLLDKLQVIHDATDGL